MQSYTVVMQEHLNMHGYLFGGVMLAWIDQYAWLAATWEHPGHDFVTVSVEEAVFKHAVENGAMLRFEMKKIHTGRTSVTYVVEVYSRMPREIKQILVFSTSVTLVSVDENCKKVAIELEK